MPASPGEPQPAVALSLASVGEWVDAVGFLTPFGLFTAQQSGNTARVSTWSRARSAWPSRPPSRSSRSSPESSRRLVHDGPPRSGTRSRKLLAVEALLATSFMVLGTVLHHTGDLTQRSPSYYSLGVVATAAMGLQSAALRHVSHVEVHTTFLTGMITALARPSASGGASPTQRGTRVHGILAGCFAGAAVGSALETPWRFWSLAIPRRSSCSPSRGAVRRRSARRREATLAEDPAAFTLRAPAPHAMVDAELERVLEALGLHRALGAHAPRALYADAVRGEERARGGLPAPRLQHPRGRLVIRSREVVRPGQVVHAGETEGAQDRFPPAVGSRGAAGSVWQTRPARRSPEAVATPTRPGTAMFGRPLHRSRDCPGGRYRRAGVARPRR